MIGMKSDSTVERRLHILKLIESAEKVDVNTLSKEFNVSEVTIRKDLRHLEKKNVLIRSRGGAYKPRMVDLDMSIYDRKKQNYTQKQLIGKLAAGLIEDGETILLDSGTTIMELVKYISKQIEITVITNALDIASRLVEYPKVRVIMPGGILRRNSLSLVGEQAAEALRTYYCDKCFIGADGIDIEKGLLTMNIEEAHLSRISIENSKKIIALIDSSKFKRKGIMSITPLNSVHQMISDEGITKEQIDEISKLGVEVVIAK